MYGPFRRYQSSSRGRSGTLTAREPHDQRCGELLQPSLKEPSDHMIPFANGFVYTVIQAYDLHLRIRSDVFSLCRHPETHVILTFAIGRTMSSWLFRRTGSLSALSCCCPV
ncbi:hypothetical protein C8Q74DRAFT_221561 [Fomes fomentarius]|nr:hypothetical protein C8Q74DRAFT_221561 [Fomes fomentarius]